jgi:hypothetical protein
MLSPGDVAPQAAIHCVVRLPRYPRWWYDWNLELLRGRLNERTDQTAVPPNRPLVAPACDDAGLPVKPGERLPTRRPTATSPGALPTALCHRRRDGGGPRISDRIHRRCSHF